MAARDPHSLGWLLGGALLFQGELARLARYRVDPGAWLVKGGLGWCGLEMGGVVGPGWTQEFGWLGEVWASLG